MTESTWRPISEARNDIEGLRITGGWFAGPPDHGFPLEQAKDLIWRDGAWRDAKGSPKAEWTPTHFRNGYGSGAP